MSDTKYEKLYCEPKFGGIAFFAMMTFYVVISFIGQLLLTALGVTEGVAFIAVCSLFSVAAMAAALFLSRFFCKKNIAVNLYMKKCDPLYFVFAVILAVGMMFGLGFVNGIIADIMSKFGLNVGGVNPPLYNIGLFILFSVLLAVFPAVAEEVFFRGVLLDSLAVNSNGKHNFYAAITVSAVFALYHCSLTQLAYQFIYGTFLSWLTLKAGSVVPSMVAHFLNNFAVLVFSFFKINVDLNSPFSIVAGVSLLVTFIVFISIYKKNENKNANDGCTNVAPLKLFWLPYGVLGAAVCAALIIGSAVAV